MGLSPPRGLITCCKRITYSDDKRAVRWGSEPKNVLQSERAAFHVGFPQQVSKDSKCILFAFWKSCWYNNETIWIRNHRLSVNNLSIESEYHKNSCSEIERSDNLIIIFAGCWVFKTYFFQGHLTNGREISYYSHGLILSEEGPSRWGNAILSVKLILR